MAMGYLVRKCLCAVLITLALVGCVSYNSDAFRVSLDDVRLLSSAVGKSFVAVDVKMNGEDNNKVLCRLSGNVYLPDRQTYSQYIRNSILSELQAAGKMDPKSIRRIKGNIIKVDMDSIRGLWLIEAEFGVDDKPKVLITSSYKFGTSYFADNACREVAKSFELAVHKFIGELFISADFTKQLND